MFKQHLEHFLCWRRPARYVLGRSETLKNTWIALAAVGALCIGCASQDDNANNTAVANNAAATNSNNATANTNNAPGATTASNETTGNNAATTAAAATFASVQATFSKNCISCHGASRPKAGINLTSYDTIMKGGKEGPVVVAGDPAGSKIIKALRHQPGAAAMPPRGALPDADIANIQAWIKAGAKNG
jgi:mono/diheme cytochrome c family protein